MLTISAGSRDKAAGKLAGELERCDREIAAAIEVLVTGSVPIGDALLWYTDWCRERELILASEEAQETTAAEWPRTATKTDLS